MPDVDVVVRSPDTDVFILLLYYSFQIHQRLFMDTGFGSHRRVLDMHLCANELGQYVSEALPALHAFTGCDRTSSFVHKAKRAPFKLMRTSQPAIDAFCRVGVVIATTSPMTRYLHWNSLSVQCMVSFHHHM